MQTLALEFDSDVLQTAVLSGTSVSDAVGTFTYTPHADGTVTPDLGLGARPTSAPRRCRSSAASPATRGCCPQLRAALTEIVQRGLARQDPPRASTPAATTRGTSPTTRRKGLSLHSWGIAVDLNVPGNQRGTVGEMDRRVVAIFKKWGFAWGGDWNYTDPMHFEMAQVVQVG